MSKHHPIREIPIEQIVVDPDSPHRSLGSPEEEARLKASIQEFGLIDPLLVSDDGPGRYLIIDGHRRFVIARDAGFRDLACVVHPRMGSGERERLRFELQATFKPLTQAERTKQRRRLRDLGVPVPPASLWP